MKSKLPVLLALSCLMPLLEVAGLPVIDHIANGQVEISSSEHALQIQASDNAIINYKSFNLQQKEAVHFQMAKPSHRILNRIDPSSISQIDGKLTSNGTVYLMNKAGLLFGPNAFVDVATLYAVAGSLSDQDFLSKIDRFSDLLGSIEVEGILKGKELILLGNSILQNGRLLAEEGQILLATAENVYLGREGEHLFIKSDQEMLKEIKPSFIASGSSEACFIHHAGLSKAKKITLNGGNASLVTVNGQLDATDLTPEGKGGRIEVLGQIVSVEGGIIDASGTIGGGQVFIGGGLHGEGLYPTALYAGCDQNSLVKANALTVGDGGKIVLWSDLGTFFDGVFSTRGGQEGGNGGYIETSSGSQFRSIFGRIDTDGPKGAIGHWDLDPHSVTIIATGATGPVSTLLLDIANAGAPASTTCTDYFIAPSVLEGAISNIQINATVDAQPSGSGCIPPVTVGQTFVSLEAPVNITTAGIDVLINTQNGTNNGIFYATGSFKTTGSLTIASEIILKGPTTFESGSGMTFDFSIDSDSSTPNQDLTITAGGTVLFEGSIGATTPLGTLNVTATGANDIKFCDGGGCPGTTPSTIATSSDITFSSNTITLATDVTMTSTSGNIEFGSNVNSVSPTTLHHLTLSTPGNIIFSKGAGNTPLGNVVISQVNQFQLLGNTNPAGDPYTLTAKSFSLSGGTGDVHLEGSLITYGGAILAGGSNPPLPPTDGGDVSIQTTGDINFYYLVQSGLSLAPVLSLNTGERATWKSVIYSTGGRVFSSTAPYGPDGHRGGDVTLSGNSLNLLGIYAGGTPAFPGTSGVGGRGGNVSITGTTLTTLRGPIEATGGAGVGGGAQDLPTLVFSGQDLNAQGADSPGNITISGPLSIGFNGVVLRGGNISLPDVTGNQSLLSFDASTVGAIDVGALSNLSYLVIDYAKGAAISGVTTAEGLNLFNAGTDHIIFSQHVTSTDIDAIANDFCVIFEEDYTTTTESFYNCGSCPPPPPPPSPPAPSPSPAVLTPSGKGFAGVWMPAINPLYSPTWIFGSDDRYMQVSHGEFFLNYTIPPVVVDALR